MALTVLKCPNCGGTVHMEEDLKQGFCVHCGSKILNERPSAGSVTVDRTPDIVNHLKVAKNALMEHDWEAAARVVENIFLMDTDCLDAWYMKALLSFRDKPAYDGIMARTGSEKLNSYDLFSKEDIKKCWGEHTISFRLKKGLLVSMMDAKITIDGKESCFTKLNGNDAIIGVSPGKHDISVSVDLVHSGGEKSYSTGNASFVSEKDHEFILKVSQFAYSRVNIIQVN